MNSLKTHRIRMRSLLFWMKQVQENNDSKLRSFWDNKDYDGFRVLYPVCPFCEGFPVFIPEGTTEAIECFCDTLRQFSLRTYAPLESRFITLTLDTINPIDVPPGAAKLTKKNLLSIRKRLTNPAKWMLLMGGTGSAKTHILFALRTFFNSYAYYVTAPDWNENLTVATKEGYADFLIGLLTQVPILIVDDFGAGHNPKSEYPTNILYSIIDHRNVDGVLAPVWISTNFTEQELLNHPSDNIRRLSSRMFDSDISMPYLFTQDDYRLATTKKEAGLR